MVKFANNVFKPGMLSLPEFPRDAILASRLVRARAAGEVADARGSRYAHSP